MTSQEGLLKIKRDNAGVRVQMQERHSERRLVSIQPFLSTCNAVQHLLNASCAQSRF